MSHNSPRVVHITPRVQAHGGTETLHNYHRHLEKNEIGIVMKAERRHHTLYLAAEASSELQNYIP